MSDFDPDARPLELRLAGAPGAISARTLQRRASSGELQRVRRGVYAAADEWSSTSSAHRARAALGAVVATRAQRPVLCGESAALIWGLPRLGRWPIEAQLADTRRSRPRSRHGVRWIQAEFDPAEIVELDGYLLTDLRRTLVDVARTRSFANAVVALDHGTKRWVLLPTGIEVPGVGRAALLDRLDGCGSGRGIRGARSAIGFSDPAAANPGESLSRVRIHELGFPAPNLQVRFPRAGGGDDIVDFDWPDHALFGEFDGRGKYLRDVYTNGRPIADIVMAEKEREDRIRRRHRPFAARWDWGLLGDPRAFARRLEESGLPRSTRAARPARH